MIRPSSFSSNAIVNTIRLFGQPRILEEAERVMNQIGAAYFDIIKAGELDPLCAFSNACREELARS